MDRALSASAGRMLKSRAEFTATMSVAICLLLVAACGGGGGSGPVQDPTSPPPTSSSPADFLATARFTTHQPVVLEQIGAHHAYALGLTGKGVRIGIDDTIVDYTQTAEFGRRVKLRDADGAVLAYSRPDGDDYFSDVDNCRLARTCDIWSGDSAGDPEAVNDWVRRIVSENGWPTRDDSVFIRDDHYSKFDALERLFRWKEVPTPYGAIGSHGTIVASVAAGKNLGVAPEATIIPIAQNLTDDQRADAWVDATVRYAISRLPAADRRRLDSQLASSQRNDYAKFDIINRSHGRAIFDPDLISSAVDSELQWYRRYLPRYLDATLQVDRPDAEKTILVYSAGNEGQRWSGLGADYPFYVPELRGHSLSVVATNPGTGVIADYSNRCGPVPGDWNARLHGPHYCLAAPGTVRGLVPDANNPGNGSAGDGLPGTSFAAPLVSGALALMMEHFRGTRGNTRIVKRMLDTADRSGRYADLETYGAGHLDLEAALSPVGSLNAGQTAQALSRTALEVPAAFGSVTGRLGGLELAAFDQQDFPFWIPLSSVMSTHTTGRSAIPGFDGAERTVEPAVGLDVLALRWTPVRDAANGRLPTDGAWIAGFGPTSASFARRPGRGGWGYGLGFSGDGYLGTRTSGAFGSHIRSGMLWTSRGVQRELGKGWELEAMGTLALGMPSYEKDAIFQASPSVLSALSVRLGKGGSRFTVEQPLRAESGTGTFRVENGRIENGRRLHDEYRIPLRPDAREVRLTLRHERRAAGGRVAIELGGAMNAGHVPGERESNIGFAYRLVW